MRLFYESILKPHARKTSILMAKREINQRVTGTYLGILHYIITPIILLLVYTFVFSKVFAIRWGVVEMGFGEFALRLFAGLIPYYFFAETINRAPRLIIENPQFVKKIIFPLPSLVTSVMIVNAFVAMCSYFVFAVFYLTFSENIDWTFIYLIILWCPLLLLVAGCAWFLSSLGVYVRDIGHTVSVVTMILMFFTPIFYPLSMVPAPYNSILWLNPLTYFVEEMRNVLFEHQSPNLVWLLCSYVGSAVIAQLGYLFFLKTSKGFADVI